MAIQLSDRDKAIFKYIEEHQVLLEKHISWFIACDDKPVLIRDRLRKLFYLDYLLCQRHGGKLPWWTTPTKPLVYMLSPMTRQLLSTDDTDVDLSDCDTQRNLLEIANLRMLFLVDQKNGLINDCQWTTVRQTDTTNTTLDAVVSFQRVNTAHRAGIINHPTMSRDALIAVCQEALNAKTADMIWIINRDEGHQAILQEMLADSSCADRIALATHQEIYKSGVVKAKWQSCRQQYISVCTDSLTADSVSWTAPLNPLQAFS